jgi:hypothetical protein
VQGHPALHAIADPPVRLRSIAGQAVFSAPGSKWEDGPAAGVCVVLFTGSDTTAMAGVVTDENGQFDLRSAPPGSYVLVASVPELHPIAMAIQVAGKADSIPDQRLVLHLHLAEEPRPSSFSLVSHPDLRAELLAMAQRDQAIRHEKIENGVERPAKDLDRRMAMIDSANTARVQEIVARYGWPGFDLVGPDGADAAFLIVQHAATQAHRAMRPHIAAAFDAGELKGSDYALYVDRALVEEGKLQRYGTRAKPFSDWKGREPVLFPIEDPTNVDKRRAELGMEPLARYVEMLKKMYFPR